MSSKTNDNKKNDVKKMSSIVKQISEKVTGKLFRNAIGVDLLILLVALFIFGYASEKSLMGDVKLATKRSITYVKSEGLMISYDNKQETKEVCITNGELKVTGIAIGGLFVIQFFSIIIFAANNKINIRYNLQPLNDLARETEKLSKMANNDQYFKNLETAIANVDASSDDKIHTNNKELLGIEEALNALLDRMRESYKQQSRFVSDASHELRTPIAVIRGYADMLDRWGKEDESILLESIDAIKNESAHMQKLIEQLLFLARGDSGRNSFTIERINLHDLMREVYEESLMIDEEHYYEFAGEDVIIEGDVSMVKQCARILIDNAAKYTTPKDIITIRTGVSNEGGYFYVQDNGIGMSESDVVHVFERFYRSDEARNRKTGGTGLGLSIAKWIVDRHKGHFNVLSRPDLGTRITVFFNTVETKETSNEEDNSWEN